MKSPVRKFAKYLRRRQKLYPIRKAYEQYRQHYFQHKRETGVDILDDLSFHAFKRIYYPPQRPGLSSILHHLLYYMSRWANTVKFDCSDGDFLIPEVFSLTDPNYCKASFSVLKRLFMTLYKDEAEQIRLDYKDCQRIDIDASAMMDVILDEFIRYFRQCRHAGCNMNLAKIDVLNHEKDEIKKVLYSIGAFQNIAKVKIHFDDVLPHELRVCLKEGDYEPINELHTTETIDYIVKCLKYMDRELDPKAETDLYKVIGEIITNAVEHATTGKRYLIGYFQQVRHDTEVLGVFNLVIFNFGKTVYEKFKDTDCSNKEVVTQMEDLSAEYTRSGLFRSAEFEEETLWTLYALQEGVTSYKDWRRGNGSIRFIESFFKLKGDDNPDNRSKLVILSGNSRITFDGTHKIHSVEKNRDDMKQNYKVMSFNKSGDMREQPDEKYVNFVSNYFPGTMISARIYITHNNTVATDKDQSPDA